MQPKSLIESKKTSDATLKDIFSFFLLHSFLCTSVASYILSVKKLSHNHFRLVLELLNKIDRFKWEILYHYYIKRITFCHVFFAGWSDLHVILKGLSTSGDQRDDFSCFSVDTKIVEFDVFRRKLKLFFVVDSFQLLTCSKLHQHFTNSFCVDILLTKNFKAKLSKTLL